MGGISSHRYTLSAPERVRQRSLPPITNKKEAFKTSCKRIHSPYERSCFYSAPSCPAFRRAGCASPMTTKGTPRRSGIHRHNTVEKTVTSTPAGDSHIPDVGQAGTTLLSHCSMDIRIRTMGVLYLRVSLNHGEHFTLLLYESVIEPAIDQYRAEAVAGTDDPQYIQGKLKMREGPTIEELNYWIIR